MKMPNIIKAAIEIMMERILNGIRQKYVRLMGLTSQRGQIAVEYVLLLVIGVAVAALITSLVVSRNPDSPGFLIAKWRQIIELIGSDVIDP